MSDPWRCELCGRHWVIKPLARDCEDRHLAEIVGTECDNEGAAPESG